MLRVACHLGKPLGLLKDFRQGRAREFRLALQVAEQVRNWRAIVRRTDGLRGAFLNDDAFLVHLHLAFIHADKGRFDFRHPAQFAG